MSGTAVCVDAGLVLRLLLDNEDQKVLAQWKQWTNNGNAVVAPSLMAYEVVGTFRRLVTEGKLVADEAADLLGLFFKLGITFHGDEELHKEALDLATQLNLDGGDEAHYLAVAKRFRAELWTTDPAFQETLGPRVPELKLL
jgi:predicted nucleic acid-binding protein